MLPKKSWRLQGGLNPFKASVVFHTDISHLICFANQMTGFYMKCNNGLKLVNNILSYLGTKTKSIKLTHFSPMFHFYTPWKRQKTFSFSVVSGGIKIEHWTKMV